MPKYSIIIPVYNASKFLKECIESILLQSYNDFEVLLIDDCSTDDSLSICRDYQNRDNRIKVFHQECNAGVSSARNRGLENAQGRFILFIDSDDFVADNYLSIIDNIITDDLQLLSFGNYEYVIKTNGAHEKQESAMNLSGACDNNKDSIWEEFIVNSFFASPWNKVYSADIIKRFELRFDTKCVCFEDYIFNINYCKHISSFRAISEPLYFYRCFENINHVSKRKWGELFDISRRVACATNEFLESKERVKNLSNIRRYTYQAYITELKSIFFRNEQKIEDALDILCKEKEFLLSIRSIKPRGKMLNILNICLKNKLI